MFHYYFVLGFLKEKGHAGSIDFLVGYGVFIRGE